MKEYKFRLKSLTSHGILISIFIFLGIQIVSLSTFLPIYDIPEMLFNPLTNLLFVNSFLIYIIIVSLKNLDGLARSYFIAKNSNKVIIDEVVFKKMIGFLLISIIVTMFYAQQFFNKFNSNSAIYTFIATLVGIFATLVPLLFLMVIFYVVKYKKNEFDDVLMRLNLFIEDIVDEDNYFDKKVEFQEHEAKFNCSIITFLSNKNKDTVMVFNINNSEYWKNLKKGTVPPHLLESF